MSPRLPARSLTATAVLLASLTLAGCSEDTEPFCSAVDDLRASVADVLDVQVDQDSLGTLQDELLQVETDVNEVRDAATDEFADEADLVQKAASSAALALDFAVNSPSAETVADVVPALELLGTRLRELADAVEDTC